MNDNTVAQHLLIAGEYSPSVHKINEILKFYYTTDYYDGRYFLLANWRDPGTGGFRKLAYILGGTPADYVVYRGRTYHVDDFPRLVKEIHNRNVENILGTLCQERTSI